MGYTYCLRNCRNSYLFVSREIWRCLWQIISYCKELHTSDIRSWTLSDQLWERKISKIYPGTTVIINLHTFWPISVALVVKNQPVNVGVVRDMSSIPGSGRPPGGGHGNPLQYSCLKNPTDRGAWGATVHGVAQSRTRLKRQHACMHACILLIKEFSRDNWRLQRPERQSCLQLCVWRSDRREQFKILESDERREQQLECMLLEVRHYFLLSL